MQYNRLLLEAINGPSKDKSGKSGYGTTTTLWEALLRGEIGPDGNISHVSESSNMVVVTNSDGSEMGYTLDAPSEVLQSSGGTCQDCLDPSTVGKNFFGMSYPGPNNPRQFDKDYDYSYVPRSLVEYPAIGHDRRYDRLKITGGSGLLTDPRAAGADWRFVGENLKLAANAWISPTERLQAGLLGIGMGIMAIPKTIGTLWSPLGGGIGRINSWYNYSNQGVNNVPDIHKH